MADFWWVRHGPTHAKTLIGHTNLPADLSDTAALNRLKKFLPSNAFLISSDLRRASETASKISSMPLTVTKSLREINFGAWEGKTFEQVSLKNPEISRKFWECPGDIAPPKGESWNVFSQRIQSEIQNILSKPDLKNIVLVAHFGVILAALQMAANLPAVSVFSFKINNLSVTHLSHDAASRAWSVNSVNQNV